LFSFFVPKQVSYPHPHEEKDLEDDVQYVRHESCHVKEEWFSEEVNTPPSTTSMNSHPHVEQEEYHIYINADGVVRHDETKEMHTLVVNHEFDESKRVQVPSYDEMYVNERELLLIQDKDVGESILKIITDLFN